MPYENKLIVVEKYENHVAKDYPERAAAQSQHRRLIAELTRVLRKIEQDDDIRAVVFTGCGQKVFLRRLGYQRALGRRCQGRRNLSGR